MVERFDPSNGKGWTQYIEWSKLDHLQEVLGLDGKLCPIAITEFVHEDFEHSIEDWHVAGIFGELEYALARVETLPNPDTFQVIAVSREPDVAEFDAKAVEGIRFAGFDLIDEIWTSSLTNCGGFLGAFAREI